MTLQTYRRVTNGCFFGALLAVLLMPHVGHLSWLFGVLLLAAGVGAAVVHLYCQWERSAAGELATARQQLDVSKHALMASGETDAAEIEALAEMARAFQQEVAPLQKIALKKVEIVEQLVEETFYVPVAPLADRELELMTRIDRHFSEKYPIATEPGSVGRFPSVRMSALIRSREGQRSICIQPQSKLIH